jgi:Flp pilus assembly protein TadD
MFATAFVAGGCNGLKKMAKNANLIQRSITPSPLEMHAGKVPVSITVNFPPKYFDKKAYIVCMPSLKSDNGSAEIKMKPKSIQGEKVKDNNKVIPYKAGGSYTYSDTIDYSDPYRRSDLVLNMKATKGSETVDIADIKIGDGVNVTPLLVEEGLKVDNGVISGASNGKDAGSGRLVEVKVDKPKSSTITKDLTMYYPMQKAALDKKELKKNEISAFVADVKKAADDANTNLKSVQVASYASPDGPEDMNANLVDQRGKTGENFAKDQLKKIDGAGNVVSRQTTQSEDWEGFKKEAEASNLKDKDLILRVLSMYSDPNVREREIKNISAAYTGLKTSVLPKLRRSEIKAVLETKEKSNSELVSLAKSNPTQLTKEEALYASTIADLDPQTKINLLKDYTSKYPNDWRGFNNLGVNYVKNGDMASAKTQFEKAKSIDGNQAAVYNNLGVVDFSNNNVSSAKEYWNKAKNLGSQEAGYNLGVINIREGEYDKAVVNFGSTPTFNKALAETLNRSTADAKATLNNVESEDAWVDYLKAIVASKNSDQDGVISNLKNAVKKNSALKDYAKKDVEFIRYFEESAFKAVVD